MLSLLERLWRCTVRMNSTTQNDCKVCARRATHRRPQRKTAPSLARMNSRRNDYVSNGRGMGESESAVLCPQGAAQPFFTRAHIEFIGLGNNPK